MTDDERPLGTDRTPTFTSPGDEEGSMTSPLSRRRLLAAAAPGLLAGCLVESEGDAGGSGDDAAEAERGVGGASSSADGSADDESVNDESSTQQVGDVENTPDEVGPNGSGLIVTNVDVLGVIDGSYETTVRARFTVENAGRFTYGTVEFRADAYATRPGSRERDAVGYEYVSRQFSSNERFAGGTRRFEAEISFRSRETRAQPDPDWYEVDAAVRRAEPV